MSQDRRQELRLPVEICVKQYLADASYLGLTRDLSEGGLYLTAPRLRDAVWFGAPLQLEFALPGTGETIWAQGTVCHEDEAEFDGSGKGLGIRLTHMAERHAASLRAYVETVRKARLSNLLLRMNTPKEAAPKGRNDAPRRREELPGVALSRWQ